MSVGGGTKPSGFSVKDILDLPNVKTTSCSKDKISSSSGTGISLIVLNSFELCCPQL